MTRKVKAMSSAVPTTVSVEDLKRKYYLLKELWEDCGRRYQQYGTDLRISNFLWNAWAESRSAYEVVEKDYRDALEERP